MQGLGECRSRSIAGKKRGQQLLGQYAPHPPAAVIYPGMVGPERDRIQSVHAAASLPGGASQPAGQRVVRAVASGGGVGPSALAALRLPSLLRPRRRLRRARPQLIMEVSGAQEEAMLEPRLLEEPAAEPRADLHCRHTDGQQPLRVRHRLAAGQRHRQALSARQRQRAQELRGG